MIKRRITAWLLAVMLLGSLALLGGCKSQDGATTESGETAALIPADPAIPECGSWHAAMLFSSLDDELPWYVRIPLGIVLGNTAFEVDVEIAQDGTFTYESNTEALKKSASGLTNTLFGLFLKDVDISMFVDNALDTVLPEVSIGKDRSCYGTYERLEDGTLIFTTTQNTTLYFKAFGKKLVQMDAEGAVMLSFERP